MTVSFARPRMIACPECGRESRVEHLFLNKWTDRPFQWQCDCGCCYRFTIVSEDAADIEIVEKERKIRTIDIVRLRGTDLYVAVDGSRSPTDDAVETYGQKRYFYEEHNCPENTLSCRLSMFRGQTDNHDAFEYLGYIDEPTPEYPFDTELEIERAIRELTGMSSGRAEGRDDGAVATRDGIGDERNRDAVR